MPALISILIYLLIGYLLGGAYLAYRILYSGKFHIIESRWSQRGSFVIITLGWLPVILANLSEEKKPEQFDGLEEALNRPVVEIATPMMSIEMPGIDSDGNVAGDDILGAYDDYLEEKEEYPRSVDHTKP
jgi:hypothetical protein